MAPLPLLKLGGLLVKTLAKPVATRLKVEARKHPRFSRICCRLGEAGHQITSRVNVFASGYKILGVNPLPEEEALSRGINIMSESVVFAVAATIIIWEYSKSEEKNARKVQEAAAAEAQFRQYLDDRFTSLSKELEMVNKRVRDLEEVIRRKEEITQNQAEKKQDQEGRGTWSWFSFR